MHVATSAFREGFKGNHSEPEWVHRIFGLAPSRDGWSTAQGFLDGNADQRFRLTRLHRELPLRLRNIRSASSTLRLAPSNERAMERLLEEQEFDLGYVWMHRHLRHAAPYGAGHPRRLPLRRRVDRPLRPPGPAEEGGPRPPAPGHVPAGVEPGPHERGRGERVFAGEFLQAGFCAGAGESRSPGDRVSPRVTSSPHEPAEPSSWPRGSPSTRAPTWDPRGGRPPPRGSEGLGSS